MSDLLRQSMGTQEGSRGASKPRPAAVPITSIPEVDDHGSSSSSSDSSASSSSSAASANTVRPSSHDGVPAPAAHWTRYFDQELYLEERTAAHTARYHVYLTVPADPGAGPLFICHHGAGASGLSFAACAREIRRKLPGAGILSLEARGHGSTVTGPGSTTSAAAAASEGEGEGEGEGQVQGEGEEIRDYSLPTLTADALAMIRLTAARQGWVSPSSPSSSSSPSPQRLRLPPCVLVGHSMGGLVMTNVAQAAHARDFGASLVGYCVLDVVEEDVAAATASMRKSIASRPAGFATPEEAVRWHLRNRIIRDPSSAEVSVPSLLVPVPPPSPSSEQTARWTWRIDLMETQEWWQAWFEGQSQKFLGGRGAKLLVLAGIERLDRGLMIGQMQGKYQLVVIPEAGHYVQEDVPEKTAGLLVEFFRRNDRSSLVLPPKVSDLIAQGKKV